MVPVVPVPIEPVPLIDPVAPVLLPPIEPTEPVLLPPMLPVEPVPIEPVPPIVLVLSVVEPVLDVDPAPVDEPLRPERSDERVLLRVVRELAPVVLWPAVLPLPMAVSTDVEPVVPPIEPEEPPVLV
jgi:hypothetical protein